MELIYFTTVFIVLVSVRGTQCTCLTELCTQTTGLETAMLYSNFSSDTCEDLKSYVHCLTTELDGCVGESGQRTALQILAKMHYTLIHRKCDYYGANSICDMSDCTYVADISEGYTASICNRMEMFVACLKIELSECGTGSIFGSQVQSEVDVREFELELHCSSGRSEVLLPLIVVTVLYNIVSWCVG